MKILIIDDDVEIVWVIRKLLEVEGYRVTTAMDGDDGYSTYLDFKPDVVITDIQMPGKNGIELMKEIRIHDPNIKTIYMTGAMTQFHPLLEEEKKRFRAGFLAKPFTGNELISLVSKMWDKELHHHKGLDFDAFCCIHP